MVFDTTILGSNPSAPAKKMKKKLSKNNLLKKIQAILFPFYKSKELTRIFKKLEKDQPKNKNIAMFVGGCVRKYILNEEIDDIDIATIFSPAEIKIKFNEDDQVKVLETGVEHGTVTLMINNKKFEITTLRKDVNTDGRHAEVEYTDDWEKDSERRDFTINAIYLDKRGKIFDPQLGVADLNNRVVKFIGDPSKRILEDYLRIIRFIRFSLYYNYNNFEPSTIEAIKLNLDGIKNISKQRILSELVKILQLKDFNKIVNSQLRIIFSVIFPELKHQDRLKKINLIPESLRLNIDSTFLLAVLLIDGSNNHEYFCHKYKVSNKTKDRLSEIATLFEKSKLNKNFFKKDLIRHIYSFGKNILKDLALLIFLENKKISVRDLEDQIKSINNTVIPKFPFNGEYLLKKGFTEGKKIGSVLKVLEKEWLDNNYSLSEKNISNIIKKAKKLNILNI